MLRRTTLGLALVVGMIVAGMVVPAHAIQATEGDPGRSTRSGPIAVPLAVAVTPEVRCETSGGTGLPTNHLYDYWVVGSAQYAPVSGNPMFREWRNVYFQLDGIPLPGNHSNVNIRIRDGGVVKFEWRSPDNQHARTRYTLALSGVYTTTNLVDDTVEIEAIFDRSGGSDPRCSTRTPPV